MVRSFIVTFAIAWAAAAASPKQDGEALFHDGEFKAAARAFEQALTSEPDSARLHFWAGKSYARLADVSSLLTASRNARKARAHLEAAVGLDPRNRAFLMELFELYVDSPEWFEGGTGRAAAFLERLGPDDGGPASAGRILADSRKEYSGWGWAVRRGILRGFSAIGRVTPGL